MSMPVHHMHVAKWSRATVDAENRRTGDRFERALRAQATNTPRGCGLELNFLSFGMIRAAPVEHSALPGWCERHPSSILRYWGRLGWHPSSILQFWGEHTRPFRASCGCGAGSSSHFEIDAAAGWARAAISSQVRLQGDLEQPFQAICSYGPG